MQQTLNGFYFLPTIDGVTHDGYVVLLREIRHLPRDLAFKIADGMTEDAYDLYCQNNADYLSKLCFYKSNYICPISQVRSPNIEHLMQCFCNTFGRIGITDISAEYIETTINVHFNGTVED